MKLGNTTGSILVELLEALEDYGIDKITLLNEIFNAGQIPPYNSKSIFIALPKKLGATLCGLHRTINLMSHINKILLRIIMIGVRNKSNKE